MRKAIIVLPRGSWIEVEPVATVTLPYDERCRRRLRMHDDAGEPFLLDLDRPVQLADGDGLGLEGGGVIGVCAAEEAVIEARGATVADSVRLAWHIGNRHAQVQVLADATIRLRADAVLADMLRRSGARLFYRLAPFNPEPGAYAAEVAAPAMQPPAHIHDHDHDIDANHAADH
ncbi:MAG: urease accessory protein UreE [Rhodospirillales bacterium]|nr:urease accessory protein UreE [Rhodospirillales bacterium]